MNHAYRLFMAFALAALAVGVVSGDEGKRADDRRLYSGSNSAAECPCALDEPFIGVQTKIKNNPGSWRIRLSPVLHSAVVADNWYRLNLYKGGKKRHSFEQKLSIGETTNALRCAWVKWSDKGAVENRIGMGYFLYSEVTEAEQALHACFKKIAGPLSATASRQNDKQTLSIQAARIR